MSSNPTQKDNWFAASQLTQSFGETGKYYGARSIAASSGTVDVTGEGYGAILIGDVTNLFITASNGTIVPTAQFDTKKIYDIGINGVSVGATGNCTIFKRQQ